VLTTRVQEGDIVGRSQGYGKVVSSDPSKQSLYSFGVDSPLRTHTNRRWVVIGTFNPTLASPKSGDGVTSTGVRILTPASGNGGGVCKITRLSLVFVITGNIVAGRRLCWATDDGRREVCDAPDLPLAKPLASADAVTSVAILTNT
jgi:hypothetical protein